MDGEVSGTTETTGQFLESPRTIIGHPDDYASQPNAKRVKANLPESTFNEWTSNASSIYSYQAFLRAVAKFPAFCGESNAPHGYSDDDTCKREIATLFTHMLINSDGMS